MARDPLECSVCDGTRYVIRRDAEGYDRADPCACTRTGRSERLLAAARIPRRYEHCDLDGYDALQESQRRARTLAVQFVEAFPAIETGLLLTGDCGVGKTHLAVGILKSLMRDKGAAGRFVDFRDLLKDIQESWSPISALSESQVLLPIFEVDVLVLDDLGAGKPTDWVRDTLGHIINRRYNDERTTIFTTNYADEALPGTDPGAAHAESLSERIGARLRSRLDEMCRVVEIRGQDYRRTVRQAAWRW